MNSGKRKLYDGSLGMEVFRDISATGFFRKGAVIFQMDLLIIFYSFYREEKEVCGPTYYLFISLHCSAVLSNNEIHLKVIVWKVFSNFEYKEHVRTAGSGGSSKRFGKYAAINE